MNEIEQRILDAAMNVFAREGWNGATTRRIAEEAGVNEVTLFRRFQSKENILRAVIDRSRDTGLDALGSMLTTEKGAGISACLRRLGHKVGQFIEERVDWIILLMQEGRRRPDVATTLASIPKAMVGRLAEYFDEQMKQGNIRSVSPRIAALTFVSYAFYNGLMGGIIGDEILGDRDKALDEFIDIFTRGIYADGKKSKKSLEHDGNMKRMRVPGVK